MTLVYRITRCTAAGLRVLSLVSALGLAVAIGHAQPPAPAGAAALPKKTFTKNNTFDLPIVMDDKLRSELREVCLYVKRPGGTWIKTETVPPVTTRFTHKVPQDGEYWFSLVTVDKQGRMTPGDVNSEPPGLRVVVDTQAPTVQVQPWAGPDGSQGLRCVVQDANSDQLSVKATCKVASGDVALEPVPGQPHTFRVRPDLMGMSARVVVSDLAGNSASRDVSLTEMFAAHKAPAADPIIPVGTNPPPAGSVPTIVTSKVDLKPAPEPVTPVKRETPAPVAPVAPSTPSLEPAAPSVSAPAAPSLADTLPKAPAEPTAKAPGNRQLLNTTQASIDYHVDQVGPSGVGKVEAYLTGDQGTTWLRICEDHDRKTPIQVNLPGEGLFGVRLAITNGSGFGGTPPKHGDSAHCWIEVDMTPPFVQLRTPEVIPSASAIEIRWTASDKNLAAQPVSLSYRTGPDGPWQSIARNLKNDGAYRWTFPRDGSSQFFFRVEVADAAGNVARNDSQAAITLDTTEPRVSVIGVSGTRAPGSN